MDRESKKEVNRPAAVAGKFYPGTEAKLRAEVQALLGQARPAQRQEEAPQAIVVPHAGYLFSGSVAASAFNQIPKGHPYERVFLLASSHRLRFPGASVWCDGDYETPLGPVTTDRETCHRLTRATSLISATREPHLEEHSLEVQLPFLQEILGPSFLLVPLVLGTHHHEECRRLAEALRPWFRPENLFVISSDLSHYPCYDDAVTTDRATTEAILANDPGKLLKTLEANRHKKIAGLATSLCGWTSVLTLLHLTATGEVTATWVDYRNSGDEPLYGDHDRVVGYSAVAFFRNAPLPYFLTTEEKATLLGIARQSVSEMVTTGNRFPPGRTKPEEVHLAEPAGAFVSIYISGKLRGCIGSFDTGDPLAEVVAHAASSAARDSRFDPPEPEELKHMSLEISVLTPLRRIHSPEEFIPGKHGITIKKDWATGTFLPQVGAKYGWTREELLGRCSRDKAGLGWEGWKNAELYVYEAIIFSSAEDSE